MGDDIRIELVDLIEDLAGLIRIMWTDEKYLKEQAKELLDGFIERIYDE